MCPLYPQTVEVAVRLLNKLFDLAESLKLLVIVYSIIQFLGLISRPVRCHPFHHSGVCRLLNRVFSSQPPICKPHKELWVKPQTEMSPSFCTRLLQDNITELRKKISRLINAMLVLDCREHLHLMVPSTLSFLLLSKVMVHWQCYGVPSPREGQKTSFSRYSLPPLAKSWKQESITGPHNSHTELRS